MRPTLTTLQDAISEYFDTCTARDTYEMADSWSAYCDDAARHSEVDDWFYDLHEWPFVYTTGRAFWASMHGIIPDPV